jgi:hypothetical protein
MLDKTQEARFWAKVEKTEKCWEWTAALHETGYGIFGIGGKRVDRAHRISWRMHFGEIPKGMIICHRCDNPRCVRPDHLFVGTYADNTRDCMEKGRHSPPPPMGGWNKIDLPKCILDRLGTQSDASLAEEAGVTKYTIQRRRNALGIPSWAERNNQPTQFKHGQPHPRWSKER